MSSAVSLIYHNCFFLGRLSPLSGLPVLVHILSPETDNYSSWFSIREIMTVEKIFHDQSSRKNVAEPGGDRTYDLLITSRMSIWLSHRGQQKYACKWRPDQRMLSHNQTMAFIASSWYNSLRKHAYSNILKFSPPKIESFQIIFFYIFLISAQNIDCGYSARRF